MGFLLGMYGKLMAGKRVRELQARMMNVQSQLRRATRDVANMEKYLNQQQRMMKTDLQSKMYSTMMGMSGSMQTSVFDALKTTGAFSKAQLEALKGGNLKGLSSEQLSLYNSESQKISTQFQYQQQTLQSNLMQQQSMMENNFEAYKEMMLEPLKDTEEDLQTEKDSLESQIQLAQQDYEACKEMEKAGVKNLTPQYTGQG